MLIHIVCWKYNVETDEATRQSHIAQLRRLTTVISDIESFEVGSDILHLDRSFDTGLVAVFADRAALDRYTDHPDHVEVAKFGRGISEKVVSVDFIK